jgi:S-adenosylmethionine:tRNA ribosyltransferase-isomerase
MNITDLDYDLPEALIAQHPEDRRDAARMLVLDRAARAMHVDSYRNVAQYLLPGDCMVLNDTRVIRARLRGRKATGGEVEIFLLRELAAGRWEALVRPSARVRPGTVVQAGAELAARVEETLPGGRRVVTFDTPDVLEVLERAGHIPLPPYIHRDAPYAPDLTRYQTVYAQRPGAVAAPTAGLHFTEDVFRSLDARGVGRATLTLHIGYGTFKPIQVEQIEDHVLDPEEFEFPEETAQKLNEARGAGGRVVAVGTTSTRVLETQYWGGRFVPGAGSTETYIYPPYQFRAVDVLQTNFHLPRSSLLALVCAFAGTEFVLEAYRFAINENFRFYSYGDVMLLV